MLSIHGHLNPLASANANSPNAVVEALGRLLRPQSASSCASCAKDAPRLCRGIDRATHPANALASRVPIAARRPDTRPVRAPHCCEMKQLQLTRVNGRQSRAFRLPGAAVDWRCNLECRPVTCMLSGLLSGLRVIGEWIVCNLMETLPAGQAAMSRCRSVCYPML